MAVAVPFIGLGLAAVSLVAGGIQGYSAYQEGKASKRAGEYNARLALQRGYARERALRRRANLIRGEAQAMVAAAGVEMSGTPIELMTQNAYQAELEAMDQRIAALQEAEYHRTTGRNAKLAGGRAFATSLLGGAASGAKTAYDYRPAGGYFGQRDEKLGEAG